MEKSESDFFLYQGSDPDNCQHLLGPTKLDQNSPFLS